MRNCLFVLMLWLALRDAGAQSVTIGWDANSETNVAGYKLLSGPSGGVYNRTNTVEGRLNNTAVATNLFAGRNVFAVLAFDDTGLESDLSNEVVWTNRPYAPKNLRASAVLQASQSVIGPWTNLAIVPLPMTNQFFVRTRLLLEELP